MNKTFISVIWILFIITKCTNKNDLNLQNEIAYVLIIYENDISTSCFTMNPATAMYLKCKSNSFPPDKYDSEEGTFLCYDTVKIDQKWLNRFKEWESYPDNVIKINNEDYFIRLLPCGYDTFQVFSSDDVKDSIYFYYNKIKKSKKINENFTDPVIGIEIKMKDSLSTYIGIDRGGKYCIIDSIKNSDRICGKEVMKCEMDTSFVLFIDKIINDHRRIHIVKNLRFRK